MPDRRQSLPPLLMHAAACTWPTVLVEVTVLVVLQRGVVVQLVLRLDGGVHLAAGTCSCGGRGLGVCGVTWLVCRARWRSWTGAAPVDVLLDVLQGGDRVLGQDED